MKRLSIVAATAVVAVIAAAPVASAATTTLHVVAMGDSYASGTGAGAYQAGTEGVCWRSANSYSEQIVSQLRADGRNVDFTNVACSGAASTDLYKEFLNQPPQLDSLRPNTDVVFLTIGTNDIGYAAYGGLCVQADCSGAPTQAEEAKLPGMAANLAQLYKDIHARSPHAKIVQAAYGSQVTAGVNATGVPLDPICAPEVFSAQERVDGNQLASQLDKTLRDNARLALLSGIPTAYVSEYTADSSRPNPAFAGHSLCEAGTPFYRGFDALAPGQEGLDAVLHLNKDGQAALACLIRERVPELAF